MKEKGNNKSVIINGKTYINVSTFFECLKQLDRINGFERKVIKGVGMTQIFFN